jgi:hypothetical protein
MRPDPGGNLMSRSGIENESDYFVMPAKLAVNHYCRGDRRVAQTLAGFSRSNSHRLFKATNQ